MKRFRSYCWPFGILAVIALMALVTPRVGYMAIRNSWGNFRELIVVLPPVFILLGLLDVWVDRETMTRMMGADAGLRGILTAFLLGSAAAGPLYVAFPIVGVMLKKGSSLVNAIIFIGAWTTTKIPLLLFETSTMGLRFALVRLLIDVPAVIIIAYATEWLLSLSGDGKDAQGHPSLDGEYV